MHQVSKLVTDPCRWLKPSSKKGAGSKPGNWKREMTTSEVPQMFHTTICTSTEPRLTKKLDNDTSWLKEEEHLEQL
jgi:hypothetical protein